MSFKDNFKKFIENQVETTIDLIFANAHGYAMTESGDITPEQAFELDKIKEQLQELIYKQTVQNLTQEQLKDLKLDGIECGNCGFDMGSGYENNGAAEDGVCNECGHDDAAQEETEFPLHFEGTFDGREYKVIDRGLSGNGNRDWRIIKFKDNGEEEAYHKSVLEKKLKVLKEPVLWNVPVMRTGYGHTLIAVTARSEEEAIELALDEAGGESFSDKSSEYTAPDGAHKIG